MAKASDPSVESTPGSKNAALVVLSTAQLLILLSVSATAIALPTAATELGITETSRSWAFTSYSLTFGGFLLLGGRIADYVGRKRTFLIGLIGFALTSALGGVAISATMFFASRALQGAFAALLAPAVLALISVTFSEGKERARAFAVYGAVVGAGGGLGLLIDGLLVEYLSWRWCIGYMAIIAVILTPIAIRSLSESRMAGTVRWDLGGAITGTAGLAALVYAVTKSSEDGWGAPSTLLFFGIAAVLLVAFILIERRHSDPLLPGRIIKNRNRGGAYLVGLVTGGALLTLLIFLTFFLQDTLGLNAIQTGLAFLPFSLGVIVGAALSVWLGRRLRRGILIAIGLILAGVGFALLTGIGIDSNFITSVIVPVSVASIGFGMTYGPVAHSALFGVQAGDHGVASALVNAVGQIGGAVGVAIMGTVFFGALVSALGPAAFAPDTPEEVTQLATITGYQVIWWISAVVLAITGILAAIMINAPRGSGDEPAEELVDAATAASA